MKRNLPAIIVRMLLNIYINQEIRVQWNNCHSTWFSVCNGVKQGASPILLCVYFDNLLLHWKYVHWRSCVPLLPTEGSL